MDGLTRQVVDFAKKDPWRLFRIMAEFVDSFEEMTKIGPPVNVFRNARTALKRL